MINAAVRIGTSHRTPRTGAVTVEFTHMRRLHLLDPLPLADYGNSIVYMEPLGENIPLSEWFDIDLVLHALDHLSIPESLKSKYLKLVGESLGLRDSVPDRLFLYDRLKLAEKYPLHITFGLFERLSVAERTVSEFRSLVAEVCTLKELGQVEMFLKILQELRSGRVSKVRAERPAPQDGEAPKGSMAEADAPPKRFSKGDRP